MEHKLFKICSIISFIILIILAFLYDYFQENLEIKILLKILPMTLLLGLNLFYFIYYRITIYSFGIFITLFLCSFGDFFLGLYNSNSNSIDMKNSKIFYFILGGVFFFLSRIILFIIFMIKPYKKMSLILFPFKKLLISHIIFETPFIILIILLIIYEKSYMSIFISFYLGITFGFPWSNSFLRIKALNNNEKEETFSSGVFGFIGMTLFNISDIILLLSLLNWIPSICGIISIHIYWLSMYFLVISIVRSSNEYIEKGKEILPLVI